MTAEAVAMLSISSSSLAPTKSIPLLFARHIPLITVSLKTPTSLSSTTGTNILVSNSVRRGGKSRRNDLDFAAEMDEDEVEEEEEEEGLMPFEKMRRWMRNRPAGFGEGKTYDVSLEEQMMEEIERSRKAQLANLNKLRTGAGSSTVAATTNKKQLQQTKAEAEFVPSGFCVRIANLPRKRNIHRDLQSAFKNFPGIVNISPAVIGNKKTRDPVCRGFAFIYFASEEVANRFVKAYSKQSLPFGKLQKPVTCHIMTPKDPSTSKSEMFSTTSASDDLFIHHTEETRAGSDPGGMTMKSHERKTGGSVRNEINVPVVVRGSSDNLQLSSSQHTNTETDREKSDSTILNVEESTSSRNDGEMQKKRATASKRKTKKKAQKSADINVPGSANRLKIKERSVLTGVFTKYGGKAAPVLAK